MLRRTDSTTSFVNGQRQEVDPGKLEQVLDDKAYIDMPNQEAFTFLNPRNIFYGIRLSFELMRFRFLRTRIIERIPT